MFELQKNKFEMLVYLCCSIFTLSMVELYTLSIVELFTLSMVELYTLSMVDYILYLCLSSARFG